MKKVKFFTGVFLLFFVFNAKGEINIFSQVPLEFCSYPDIKEGIVDILYSKIEISWHRGEYEKIFPLLNLITFISPDEKEAWSLGGWFLINALAPKYRGEKRKEIEDYGLNFLKKGLEKNRESSELYFEIAWIYYKKMAYTDCLEYLNQAEKYPHKYRVENLKAHTLEKLGKIEEAIKEWEKIKEKYPELKDIAERFIEKLKKGRDEKKDFKGNN